MWLDQGGAVTPALFHPAAIMAAGIGSREGPGGSRLQWDSRHRRTDAVTAPRSDPSRRPKRVGRPAGIWGGEYLKIINEKKKVSMIKTENT